MVPRRRICMHRPPASADISIASALSLPSGMTTFFCSYCLLEYCWYVYCYDHVYCYFDCCYSIVATRTSTIAPTLLVLVLLPRPALEFSLVSLLIGPLEQPASPPLQKTMAAEQAK